jgi:hypothetical protein
VRAGTSKGSTINQYGCSTFGALATEAQQQEEKFICMFVETRFVSVRFCSKYCVTWTVQRRRKRFQNLKNNPKST